MKKTLALVLSLVMLLSLAACGGSGNQAAADGAGNDGDASNDPAVKLVYAEVNPLDTIVGQTDTFFAEKVAELTGGTVTLDVQAAGVLGSENDVLDAMVGGSDSIDISRISAFALSNYGCSKATLLSIPYTFTGRAHFWAFANSDMAAEFLNEPQEVGIPLRGLFYGEEGFRHFFFKNEVKGLEDLKGLKIRVQQSPTNVAMMELLGGTATPMGFGDVYTALQSQIINGAENNELALTSNGHGDVCKYYSYDMHQMIPDLVLCNWAFLEGLSESERAVFDEGFKIINSVQRAEWTGAVEAAKEQALNEQGVNFLYPDTAPFQQAVMPLHNQVLEGNPALQPIYDMIQAYNAEFSAAAE